jgi:parallel beta-helix repeat protein
LKACVYVFALALLLSTLGCVSLVDAYTDVTVAQARIMVDSNSAVTLDVRSQSEYDSGHIRNAKLIPVTDLQERLNELDKNDSILVYCLGGGRSKTASQLLTDNGFEHVSNMLGGISAWTAAGYPVYVRYASIQQAINGATSNTTLLVGSGTYAENLLVSKPLELVGENRNTTVISANANESERCTVVINASNVQMREFTIQSSNGSSVLGSVTMRIARPYINNTISNNRISSDCSGIEIFNSTRNTVDGNDIESGRQGIILDSASDNNISNNRIACNYHGIEVRDSTRNTIFGNDLENNTVGILVDSSSNNDLRENNITGNTYGMIFNNSTGNTASKNTAANNVVGIRLTISNHNIVSENNITSNDSGIDLQSSSNNSINRNSVLHDNFGISLLGCSNNSLTANEVASNNNDGIVLDSSSGNKLDQNSIEANGDDGIWLANSSNNSIRVNRIANNNHAGISLDSSSNNDVYRNDFVNNTRQAFNDLFSVNMWDHGYPSGGNYWSDCNRTDSFRGSYQNETGSDGIVDTPYVIDENNTDQYSLMRPYGTRCDITGPDGNPDGKVDMRDISHVARRFMCIPGNPLWDPYADINGDGKIDMIDIGTVARFFGAHY